MSIKCLIIFYCSFKLCYSKQCIYFLHIICNQSERFLCNSGYCAYAFFIAVQICVCEEEKKKSCVDENLRTEACCLILFVKMLLCIWLFKTCTVFTCKHLTHRWWKYEPVRILSNVLSHTFFSANWCKFADVCLKMLCTFFIGYSDMRIIEKTN